MSLARCFLCDWTASAPSKRVADSLWNRHYLTEHPAELEVPF